MLGFACVGPASAATIYKVDSAQAKGNASLHCAMPRSGLHHVALVYRDTHGVREKYRLSVVNQTLGTFEANLTEQDLIDGGRFWVWFTPTAYPFSSGDKLKVEYRTEEKGQADLLEIYFVKPEQLNRLKAIIAQESLAVPGHWLYTKLVNHYDHFTWQTVPSNDSWLRISAATQCEFGPGFNKGVCEGTSRSIFVDFVTRVFEVRTWGFVEPAKGGTVTKPIVTMKAKFHGPRLFDGKDFWIATRGTTTHGLNQLSPMFPMVGIDANGARKVEIDRCLAARKEQPTKDPRFGGPIPWETGPIVYVIAHVGMDHYGRHRDGAVKDRPELDKERTLTAYMIRVSDGTPESNKHRWPLYYWNSWLHRSDLQPLDEELTLRYAAIDDPQMWFFAVGAPQGLKKYMAEDDLTFVNKQGSWNTNSYLTYQIGRTKEGKPRFIPHGYYLKPFTK